MSHPKAEFDLEDRAEDELDQRKSAFFWQINSLFKAIFVNFLFQKMDLSRTNVGPDRNYTFLTHY